MLGLPSDVSPATGEGRTALIGVGAGATAGLLAAKKLPIENKMVRYALAAGIGLMASGLAANVARPYV